MRRILLPITLAAFTLGGCANQTPESQLQRKDTVRVCQDSHCTERASSTVTFQPEPVDAAAAQRLQALTHLAEQNTSAVYDLRLRLLRGASVLHDSSDGSQCMRRALDNGLDAAQLAPGQLYLGAH